MFGRRRCGGGAIAGANNGAAAQSSSRRCSSGWRRRAVGGVCSWICWIHGASVPRCGRRGEDGGHARGFCLPSSSSSIWRFLRRWCGDWEIRRAGVFCCLLCSVRAGCVAVRRRRCPDHQTDSGCVPRRCVHILLQIPASASDGCCGDLNEALPSKVFVWRPSYGLLVLRRCLRRDGAILAGGGRSSSGQEGSRA